MAASDWYALINLVMNAVGLLLFVGLLVYSRNTRKMVKGQDGQLSSLAEATKKMSTQITDLITENARLSGVTVMLTNNVDSLRRIVEHGFNEIADKEQMNIMMENLLARSKMDTILALSRNNNYNMMGTNSAPSGGTNFEAAATVHGGIAGSNIGTSNVTEGKGENENTGT